MASKLANSSTNGNTGRTVGNLGVTGSITRHISDLAAADFRAPNSIDGLRLYINATEFYDFERVMVQDRADITVPIEGQAPEPVNAVQNWTFKPVFDVAGTATRGHIKGPGTPPVDLWP